MQKGWEWARCQREACHEFVGQLDALITSRRQNLQGRIPNRYGGMGWPGAHDYVEFGLVEVAAKMEMR
jgi:hypothetical protein